MAQFFLAAFGLGLVFSATPGAVNAESLRRGAARGFRAALLVQLGSLIGDVIWAAIALTGTALFARSQSLRLVLGLAGACFLLRLAWSALRDAHRGTVPDGQLSLRHDFLTGFFFSATNPFALAFWLGIGAGMTATVTSGAQSAGVLTFFLGFMAGAVLWCGGFAAAVGWGRRHVRPGIFRWLNAVCGVTLGYFGLRLLWQSLRVLRPLRYLRVLIG